MSTWGDSDVSQGEFDHYDVNHDGVVDRTEFNDGVATGCTCMIKNQKCALCKICQGRKIRPKSVLDKIADAKTHNYFWREASVGGPSPNGPYHKPHRSARSGGHLVEPVVGGYYRDNMTKGDLSLEPPPQCAPVHRPAAPVLSKNRKLQRRKDHSIASKFSVTARSLSQNRASTTDIHSRATVNYGTSNRRYMCNPERVARPELGERSGTVPTGMRRGRADPGMPHRSDYQTEYIKRKGGGPQLPTGTRFNNLDPVRWLGIGPQGMSGVHGNTATALDRSRTMRFYEEPSTKWAPQKKLSEKAAAARWRAEIYATPHYKVN